ncbi:MAG: A/G-specific adenine glycosylase [Gammaproteobacteria bacterium]|nr:A/G-specific adenine glycosylase [Gammaproteobacteria bacterium]
MTDWFATRVLAWAREHGRVDLPWQHNRTPYRVWVSEVMLQQTQVHTTISYFERFIATFPSVADLASASLDEVLQMWSGLGYYRRARLLHRTAQLLEAEHDGALPDSFNDLIALPGVGRSTAGAILASGFDKRGVVLDGNVKRVLARVHAVEGEPNRSVTLKALWAHADTHTPEQHCADYVQAIVDFGALCCTKTDPKCHHCPLREHCRAQLEGRVGELPQRAKRNKPREEAIYFLLVMDGTERLLLEQQPAEGLFGSMWLPPRRSKTRSLHADIEKLGFTKEELESTSELEPFIHELSHIRFHVHAHMVRLTSRQNAKPQQVNVAWFDLRENQAMGLAGLTRKLIKQTQTL